MVGNNLNTLLFIFIPYRVFIELANLIGTLETLYFTHSIHEELPNDIILVLSIDHIKLFVNKSHIVYNSDGQVGIKLVTYKVGN